MAILIVANSEDDLAEPTIRRLLAQGDEVRILTDGDPGRWRAMGVHPAAGDPSDADLVERAAQNCRSIVLLGIRATEPDAVAAVAEGGLAAGTDRLILCRGSRREKLPDVAAAWPRGYVILEQVAGRWPRVQRASSEEVAEAVDAADDIAGEPRFSVDLNDPADLAKLGL